MTQADEQGRATEANIKRKAEANNRADFIKRFFAVVVSVGFATQLIQMGSVKKGELPAGADLVHVIYLFVALVLIIQSWEEYFISIEDRQLTTPARFYVDIAILTAYLLLLTYSSSVLQFLLFVWLIFLLYWVWELLAYVEYPDQYAPKSSIEDKQWSYPHRMMYAIRDTEAGLRRGLSTILALIYFLMLYFIYLDARHAPSTPGLLTNPYFYAALVLAGLIGYRIDQASPKDFKLAVIPAALGVVVFVVRFLDVHLCFLAGTRLP